MPGRDAGRRARNQVATPANGRMKIPMLGMLAIPVIHMAPTTNHPKNISQGR
jgi:hypothetical protein